MRIITLAVIACLGAGAAHAQQRAQPPQAPPPAPPAVGAVVDRLEMAQDRTIYFEPTADGKFRIVSVLDGDPHSQVPKKPGQVGVAFSYAPEIGSVLDINSGLDFAFDWTAELASPQAGESAMRAVTVCPVGRGQIAAEQWPASYPMVVLSRLTRHEGAVSCER